jgi:F-type H+-transporting ATPase subunit delta
MATQTSALAQAYAKSLYQLAEQAGGREKVFEIGGELEQICELTRADRRLAELLVSPIVDRARRSEAINRIFADRVTDLTLRFLLVVNSKARFGEIEAINAAYDQLVQEAHGRVEVDVHTAVMLGEPELREMAARMRTALGKEIVLHQYHEPALIGGIRLRLGDQLIDGSIATRLRRMRQSMMSSGGSALRGRLSDLVDEGGSP